MPLSIYEMEGSYGRHYFRHHHCCAERCDHRAGGPDAQKEVSRKAGGKDDMKEIKVEWCENWIKHTFGKLPFENGGIYVGLFWDLAEKSGLWVRGTYGTPMSTALSEITRIETIRDSEGNYLFDVFKLA